MAVETRTVCACDVAGLVDWAEKRIRDSKTHLITLNFDRESVRSVLANNKFVAFFFNARSDREFRKYVRHLIDFITGHSPGGLGLTIGFISAKRDAPKLSTLAVFDIRDAVELPAESDEDD